MYLSLQKTKLRKFLLCKVGLPLVFCLLSALAYAHTIELRAKLNNDGSATFYARSYHGMDELPSGGFIVDGVTYLFQGVIPASGLPDGSVQISSCSYSYSNSDYYQWVTVPNFNSCVPHTFNCTSNSPETPFCNLTNTMMLGAAQITLQPAFANGIACVGSASNLHVEVSGNNLTYHWEKNTGNGFVSVSDDAVYSGSHTSTLTIKQVTEAMASDVFRCVVHATDACNNPSSVTSNQVPLTPGYPVAITTQPADVEACFNTNTSFSVAASGSQLSYQWQVSTDGDNYSNIPGAKSATLQLNNVSIALNGNKYRVVITGSCSTETSDAATLTVADKAVITTQPKSHTICEGGAATLSATVTGLNLSYQWQVSTDDGTSFANVNGAVTPTLNLNSAIATMNGYQYRLMISGGCGPDIFTDIVTLTVRMLPVLTANPSPVTICDGGNAVFAVAGTGTGISYQWEVNKNGDIWTALTGEVKATLNLSRVTTTMSGQRYRCVISGACNTTATSEAVMLTVNSVAAVTGQPQSITVCSNDNASFEVAANNDAVTYQWQVSTNNGISWSNISGAANAKLTVNEVSVAMNGNVYRALVKGQCGTAVASDGAQLSVNMPPAIAAQPADRSVCAGVEALFSVTASGTDISYQWQSSSDNGATWNSIPGATENSYRVTNPIIGNNGTKYHVVITGTCSNVITSATATLTVVKPVAAFTFDKYCENIPVSFTNKSTAIGTGPVKYSWDFGDGASSNLTDTRHTYTEAGTYTVQLIATPAGCPLLSDTTEQQIVVDKPVAGVRLATIDAVANRSIQLQPRNFYANYKWHTKDGSVNSTVQSPVIKLQSQQTVYVNMEFASGCTTTDSVLVRIFKNDDVFVPSAFTPDGDGHNDHLKVIMVQTSKLKSFRVFNRWGNLVFETNDPSKGWDGNWKGERQRGETYLWYCEAVGHDGSIIKKSGNVTLIR